MITLVNPYIFSQAVASFTDITVAWSLNKIFTWDNAVLRIRRSSDNALAYVFFDGATANDTITTSSYISTSSDTTPSTTTLGTWVGANDAFVHTWYGMTYDNVINTNRKPTQATNTSQPKFMTAGSIITENGKPSIYFDGGDFLRQNATNIISELAPNANPFTIFTISSNDTAASYAAVFCNHYGSNFAIKMANDTRTTGGIYRGILVQTASGTYTADLASGQGVNQRMLTMTCDGAPRNFSGYYNGTFQNSSTYSGAYGNDDIIIGAQGSAGSKITGDVQEILIFPSEFSASRLNTMHTNRNAYYSIY